MIPQHILQVCLLFNLLVEKSLSLNSPMKRESSTNIPVCGEIYLEKCTISLTTREKKCWSELYFPNHKSLSKPKNSENSPTPVTKLHNISVSQNCRISLCQHDHNMGDCLQMPKLYTTKDLNEYFPSIPNSINCFCPPTPSQQNGSWTGENFDRNYFGVHFRPMDRLTGNISYTGLAPVNENSYTKGEIIKSLENIATKFTNILVDTGKYPEKGSRSKTLLAGIPDIAAGINKKYNFPVIRLTLLSDNSYITHSVMDMVKFAKQANEIYPGTVWSLAINARHPRPINGTLKNRLNEETLKEIELLREISPQSKIGVNIYHQDINLQESVLLYDVTQVVDFVIISTFIKFGNIYTNKDSYKNGLKENLDLLDDAAVEDPLEEDEMKSLKRRFTLFNPNLKVIFYTGFPSDGVLVKDNLKVFQRFWYRMARFGVESKSLVFMYEAVDQPTSIEKRTNNMISRFGWWRRMDNSIPPSYLEKIEPLYAEMKGEAEKSTEGKINLKTRVRKDDQAENFWGKIPGWEKALVGGLIVFLGVALGIAIYFRKKLQEKETTKLSNAEVNCFLEGGNTPQNNEDKYAVVLRIPYDRKYELAEENFFIDKSVIMGSGQSGVVFSGIIKDIGKSAAFKCTTFTSSVTDVKQLLSEIKILSYLGTHENIVCLLGAYTRKVQKGIVYVALENCSLGSVESFLRNYDPTTLFRNRSASELFEDPVAIKPGYVVTALDVNLEEPHSSQNMPASKSPLPVGLQTFLQWSYQVASGMEFVSRKKIVHADLATRNLLLASRDNLKISDFGLSKKLYQDVEISNQGDYTPLPWRWMAPESLKNLTFSVETDVWSFGVTIWEIFSLAEIPYHGFSYNLRFVDGLEQGLRLECPKFGNDLIHERLLQCWSLTPLDRPTFQDLKDTFHHLIGELCNDDTNL